MRHRSLIIVFALMHAAALAASGTETEIFSLGPTLKLSQAEKGGLLVKSATPGQFILAPQQQTRVAINIRGPIARTTVTQEFSNPSNNWVEAIYAFPLPEGCAVDSLHMIIGDRIIEGEIHEKAEAKKIYTQAKREGRRASLLEQERPNLFTTSVANIPPQASIEIRIGYQQILSPEENRYHLRFPTVIGPRYIPGVPTGPVAPGPGWATPTWQVPDACRITPPLLPPGLAKVNPFEIEIDLDAGAPLSVLESPSHQLRINRTPGSRISTISLAGDREIADRDFILEWEIRTTDQPQASVFHQSFEGRDYLMVLAMPPHEKNNDIRIPRESIFVIDTSGSMGGASIRQAREALLVALDRLSPGDRFNVISFSNSPRLLFPASVAAGGDRLAEARSWVSRLQAGGGTNILPALDCALDDDEADSPTLRQVVFLTDGSVGNENQLFAFIKNHLGRSRLFTIGIGSAPNSHFMEQAAHFGRGSYTYIGRVDEIAEKMQNLFAKIENPVLGNIQLDFGDREAEFWPPRIPDLYLGEPVLVTAELDSLPPEIVISGDTGAAPWAMHLKTGAESKGSSIHRLWAREKIKSLSGRLLSSPSDETLKQEITTLALHHHLISKYTSLVAVDVTPIRPTGEKLEKAAIPTNLPRGWDYSKVFGRMPQSATPSSLLRLLGLLFLAGATLVLRINGGRF